MASEYKLNLDTSHPLHLLLASTHPVESSYTNIRMDTLIYNHFNNTFNENWASLPFRAMPGFYTTENKVSTSEWLNTIKSVFPEHNLDLGINVIAKLVAPQNKFCKIMNTTGVGVDTNLLDSIKTKELRDELIRNLSSCINHDAVKTKEYNTFEKIRLLAARRIHLNANGNSNKVWKHISNSSLYEFMFIRSSDALKRAYYTLPKPDSPEFSTLNDAALEWCPSTYSVDSIILNMKNH